MTSSNSRLRHFFRFLLTMKMTNETRLNERKYFCSWSFAAVETSHLFCLYVVVRAIILLWKKHNWLLRIVKCRKLRYFGHVVRAHNLCTSILHAHIDGTRPRGKPSRRWTDDIREWTGMTIVEYIQTAEDRVVWRAVTSLSTVSDLQQ